MNKKQLILTERQYDEIRLAMFYKEELGHGTDGHHRLSLIATLAEYIGFKATDMVCSIATPNEVDIDWEAK